MSANRRLGEPSNRSCSYLIACSVVDDCGSVVSIERLRSITEIGPGCLLRLCKAAGWAPIGVSESQEVEAAPT